MTIEIIQKDISTVEKGTILQQVNCQGVMGSGVALAIADKWPIVKIMYEDYVQYHTQRNERSKLLGLWQAVTVAPGLKVINVFAQMDYGYDGEKYTNYEALSMALDSLARAELIGYEKPSMYIPYNMGCDRGGGDWEIYSKILNVYGDWTACKL